MDNSTHILEKLADALVSFYNEKKKTYGKKSMHRFARDFVNSFRDRRFVRNFIYSAYFILFRSGRESKIDSYMKSLYLSKDYHEFKRLRPIDVVRYVRFYLGKNKFPLPMTPFLLKKARLIKKGITEKIRYRLKKEPFLTEEAAFELVKKEMEKKGKKSGKKKKALST